MKNIFYDKYGEQNLEQLIDDMDSSLNTMKTKFWPKKGQKFLVEPTYNTPKDVIHCTDDFFIPVFLRGLNKAMPD
jgi:hypothetical protein